MSFIATNSNLIAEPDYDPHADRMLWISVLREQVRLALSDKYRDEPFRLGAVRWFGTRDYFLVCSLAGYDGHYLLPAITAKLAHSEVGR